jgi:hypothetical protein
VVSYVARTPAAPLSLTFDLKRFITDAAQHGIQPAWYLTDVFAGFEIWSGGDTLNLEAQEFTAVVE